MAQELALIRWTDTNIFLNPNFDDFAVPAWVLHALRGAPGERRRSIKAGTLECQRCVEISRPSTSVHLRSRGDRLVVVHNKSAAGPCYKPESPEHVALKERVASCAERHGFDVRLEVATADRKGRADVEVVGPEGQRIGHEIQLSPVNSSALARRNNTALRDGRTPSWLTTDQSAHSATRNLVDRVPWAMSNKLPVELIKRGRPLRVSAGMSKLEFMRCRDLPGHCVGDPGLLYCSGWHTRWKNIAEPVEDFVGKTAAGLYLPVTLPTDLQGIRRRWVSPADRELYEQATGYVLDRALPPTSKKTASTPGKRSWDSRLHQGEEPAKVKKRRGRARVSEVVRGDVVVGTLYHLPVEAEHLASGQVPSLEEEVSAFQRWVNSGLSVSETAACRVCGTVPTRPYLSGRRCFEHAPDQFPQHPKVL